MQTISLLTDPFYFELKELSEIIIDLILDNVSLEHFKFSSKKSSLINVNVVKDIEKIIEKVEYKKEDAQKQKESANLENVIFCKRFSYGYSFKFLQKFSLIEKWDYSSERNEGAILQILFKLSGIKVVKKDFQLFSEIRKKIEDFQNFYKKPQKTIFDLYSFESLKDKIDY